ncbi:molybdate ABC transporter permease subunit [Rheinheimera sp. 4Y26]|uniref:molybdate ABC transporter permease subunit n=1 Tax=Rheinheimera sp. 4Y26 TaxID=2977811 RepID=UPI0021B0CF5C|nr:molybdate ABC transporter permease subunit [Rheinheimera sp. 4Y26]MCT6697972.1 molybdate ABC transporter permease subunit [Rheinheimera sp. 4Y26]
MNWSAIQLSLWVASVATVLNLLLAGGCAYVLARRNFAGKSWFEAVLTLPMVLPPTVVGYYLLVLLGRNSALGGWLESWFGIRLIFTIEGAIVAATVVTFPLVLKPARAAFEAVDSQLIQAGKVLGLSNFAVFCRITLPLAWRGMLAGLMLAFARAMGEFGATLMLAGSIAGKTQTLSIAIYEAVQAGEQQSANELVLITSVLCVVLLVLANLLTQAKQQQPGSGR